MKDNVLKKEFSKKDVNRLRNLVQGKHGAKTQQSVGYTKKEEFHQEGDIWEEDGRKWTIKNGIKQNITKLDKAKKAHLTPLFCPNCKTQMKKKFDSDYYKIHRMCYDCVIEFEHQLRLNGLYEEYEKRIVNADIDGFIKDLKFFVEAKLSESNDSFITEQGDVENWKGGIDKNRALEALAKSVDNLEKLKRQ